MPRWTLDETMDQLLLHIRAGHPVIYITSYEEERVLNYLAKLMRVILAEDPRKNLLCWYEGQGLKRLHGLRPFSGDGSPRKWLDIEGLTPQMTWQPVGAEEPTATLNSIKTQDMNFPVIGDSLTVFFDLHPFLRNDSHQRLPYGSLVRPVRNVATELRKYYERQREAAAGRPGFPFKTLVVVAPSRAEFSVELERDVIVVEFPLPEQAELLAALNGMVGHRMLEFSRELAAEDPAGPAPQPAAGDAPAAEPPPVSAPLSPQTPESKPQTPESKLGDLIAGAGRGLTLEAYKLGLNGFAVRDRRLGPHHVEDMLNLKANAVNNPALQYTPHVEVTLAGLDAIKQWIRRRRDLARYESIRDQFHLPPLKGVMLCGVSGGGKSMLAKLIAKEFSLALLRLDVGALFGSFIGESEQRTREALQLAEVLAPIVLWLDEIDKAFSGIHGGGDNGVSARVFGAFLTWLAEKQDSVFVVATANDFRRFLDDYPEFGRKGRFDEIFWVDLPNAVSRRQIFEIYLGPYFGREYLAVTDQDVDQLADGATVPRPDGGNRVERLARVLSEPTLSGYMTGAEIEHAVKECVYEVYNLPAHQRGSLAAGQVIVDTVQKAKDRAMYKPGSPAAVELGKLREQARINGWPFVGDANT